MPTTFTDLGLLPSLLKTLAEKELVTLTEVQALALPELLARRSVAAIAETGSGKTLCYVLPILDRLKRMEEDGNRVELEGEPRAIVIVPTRELGEQVAVVFKTFTHDTRLRVRTVLGGQKSKVNRENVAGQFEVLVATPGRLEQLMLEGNLSVAAVRFIVLDEADQLLDDGFISQVTQVVSLTPSLRQLALFSATMSEPVRMMVRQLFSEAKLVETTGAHKVVPSLRTRHVDVPDGKRLEALLPILREWTEGGTLLFANTREQCDRLAEGLRVAGFTVAVHRGNMDPNERRRNLAAFRKGEIAMLIATDMGARGLDIERVSRVVNVHLPQELDAYLHRVGRTARAGRYGVVINLVTPRDAELLAQLGDGHTAPEVKLPPKPAPRGPGRPQR